MSVRQSTRGLDGGNCRLPRHSDFNPAVFTEYFWEFSPTTGLYNGDCYNILRMDEPVIDPSTQTGMAVFPSMFYTSTKLARLLVDCIQSYQHIVGNLHKNLIFSGC